MKFLKFFLLFHFVLNIKLCYTAESCFGGIETFEKTAMADYGTEIRPAGTLLQQMDQALTRDCINQCKNQPVCSSFGLDYNKFICAAYQYTSSQIINSKHLMRDKLQPSNSTNYFEKVCYKGMSRDDYHKICGLERLWAFERVMDAFLDGFEDLSIPSVASKEDCAKLCLIESTFNCRSANFDHDNKICRLSREDRRTQPQAFRQVYGNRRDYLENQCAAAGPTKCLYDTKRDTTVITMDSLIFAENLIDCQQKCDKENTFNCRAFSLNGKKCFLSGDDTISLSNSALPSKQGFIYGEKHCVTEHCTNGLFTYEKTTGHVLRTAITASIDIENESSNVGITGSCKKHCDNNPLNCPAFQVNYLSSRCDYLDRNSQGRQLELIERDGENYFEKICLRIPTLLNSSCRDKYWIFERILGYELNPLHYDRVYDQVLSRRDCEEYCLLEKTFICRSALYNDENAVCKLSKHDRRTKASEFIRNNNFKISYLENQCVSTYSKCEYETTMNAYPTYTDLVVNFTGIFSIKDEKQGKQLCEIRCNESREFLCRSYAFYSSTNECFLSGDDTVSGYMSAISSRNAMEYSERKCTKRNELDTNLDEMIDNANFDDKNDNRGNENDPSFRTTPPNNFNNNKDTKIPLDTLSTPSLNRNSHKTTENSYSTKMSSIDDSDNSDTTFSDKQDENDDSNYKTTDYSSSSKQFPTSLKDETFENRHQSNYGSTNYNTESTQTYNNYDKKNWSPSKSDKPSHTTNNFKNTFFNSDGSYTNETSFDNHSTPSYTTSVKSSSKSNPGTARPTTNKWNTYQSNNSQNNKNFEKDSHNMNVNKKCPSKSDFTFERIPNFEPIGGQLFFLHSDSKSSAIALDCMHLCKINLNCTGFILDYERHACHGIFQMYSFSKLDLRLTPGKDFFEGVCIENGSVDCEKSWTFDRIIDQTVVRNMLQPRLVLTYIDKHNCKMACLKEKRFNCRSVAYDLTSKECRFFDENRDSGGIQLQFTRGTEYMENQCNFYDSNSCQYNSIERDLTITSIIKSTPGHSTFYCEQLCNSEKEFNCRSYTYLDQTIITHGNLCLLSADSRYTSLTGSMKHRPKALFAEKDCKEGSRKGREKLLSDTNERSSQKEGLPTKSSHKQPFSTKNMIPKEKTHNSSMMNEIGSDIKTDKQDYEEPAVELPNFDNKNRDCVYNEFTFEKTYGRQIRHSKRERIFTKNKMSFNGRDKRFANFAQPVFEQNQSIITNKKTLTSKRDVTQTYQNNMMSTVNNSLTADCQDECMRRGLNCKSFIVEYGPTIGTEQCFVLEDAAEERTDYLDHSKYGAYFEKICLREKHCNKLWTFDRVVSFMLDIPAKRIFQANTKLDCEDLCLGEEKFVCKSATFNYETRICKLYNENRRTRPNLFKSTKHRIDYLENQCVKEPTTCQYKEQLNSEFTAVDKVILTWNIEECTQFCNSEKLFNCKSINFNHFTRECSMSSDELTSINIINSVKFSPVMLSSKINSVYSEKGSCEHISVQCNNANMVLTLNFDSAFFGRIYSKANPTQCYLTGNGENHLEFPIPLTPTCGTRQEGVHNYINEVVIQQHSVIMTDLDKTIKVLCSFEQSDQTVTLNKNNHSKPGIDVKSSLNARNRENEGPNSIVTNTAAPPTIVMKILDKSGNEANYVSLGDELMLKIEIKERKNSPFGIFARNLFAKSSNNEVLHLLDSEGCPIDNTVFPEMQIDPSDKISLKSIFKAFRFPSTGVVNFEVQIKFCPNKCEPANCGKNFVLPTKQSQISFASKQNFGKRKRRDIEKKILNEKSINSFKNFKEIALQKEGLISILPKPQSLKLNTIQEINSSDLELTANNSTMPKPSGLIYPSNQDLLSYTISYQPNSQHNYKQRDLSNNYNLNGNTFNNPFVTKNFYQPNSYNQDYQNLNSSYNFLSANQLYNPFSFTSNSNPISYNNLASSRFNENKEKYLDTQLPNKQKTILSNNFKNQNKFVPPRPLLRLDGQPGVPKITDDINESESDQEFPLSLAILVNDKKKDALKKANVAEKKKLSLIEKKNKLKAIERNYQSQFMEQCNTGPVILYTALLITLIYIFLTTVCYFYYTRYIKYYTDQKLLVSRFNPNVIQDKKIDSFNFNLPPVQRTNQLSFENRPSNLFHNNLNETIRSLSSSSLSGFNPLYAQNFQTKAKRDFDQKKLTQNLKIKQLSKELPDEKKNLEIKPTHFVNMKKQNYKLDS